SVSRPPDHAGRPGSYRAVSVAMAACAALTLVPAVCGAQQPDEQENKRILWIIPNYRTSPTLKDYVPLTTRQKFTIAKNDSFDRGTFVLAALFAAEAHFTRSTPSFGHGFSAYGRYAAASYTDLVIGNFMTEAIYPTLLRQDPRYFRRGTG